jgi:hypothetical protein
MKAIARDVRAEHGLTTPRVLRSDLRRIYKKEKIRIDLWTNLKGLRGAYFKDDGGGASVMLSRDLPDDPAIFTLAHELKHHLVDRDSGVSFCSSSNEKEPIEIGAEIFAAEFLFTEQDFIARLEQLGVQRGACSAADLVRLKVETGTTLSHAGLAKRALWLAFAPPGTFDGARWREIKDEIYGVPRWLAARRRKQPSS